MNKAESCFEGTWTLFETFTGAEVYELLKLRQDIFVVEQACAYADIDGLDPVALHYVLKDRETGELAGAIRVFLPALPVHANDACTIGRVIVSRSHRGRGLGHVLIGAAVKRCLDVAPGARIRLSAQAHLEGFYRVHGFQTVSEIYLEDGIEHIEMVLPAQDAETRRSCS